MRKERDKSVRPPGAGLSSRRLGLELLPCGRIRTRLSGLAGILYGGLPHCDRLEPKSSGSAVSAPSRGGTSAHEAYLGDVQLTSFGFLDLRDPLVRPPSRRPTVT